MNDLLNQKGRWAATLMMLGIFFLGMVSSAVIIHLGHLTHIFPHHGPEHGSPLHVLTRELNLDADQQKKIEAIMERRHQQMMGIVDGTHAEIRELLRPDQRERFDHMRMPMPPPPHPDHGPDAGGHKQD